MNETQSSRAGFFYALGAYVFWGALPLYMKALDHIPAAEIVAHRIVWSVPVAAILLIILRRTGDIRAAFSQPSVLVRIGLSAFVITLNWGVYVWAVLNNVANEAALGYYINPLISIVFGYVLLSERLTKAQWVAVALAAFAVLLLTVQGGQFPWVALVLAFSFATYGYIRKTVAIGATQGFLLEVIMLMPFALCYLLYLAAQGTGHFGLSSPDLWLLLGCGPVTAVPLILYAFGARALRLSTIGIMQYIAPSLIFLLAFFVFNEDVTVPKLTAFAIIWTALAIYSWSMFRGSKTA
ncbi:MAG: EamA family transporter RarD [Pseudomonadota bacterium]